MLHIIGWSAGFLCGVGITGSLMMSYWKADWVKPHIQKKVVTTMGKKYVHRKR